MYTVKLKLKKNGTKTLQVSKFIFHGVWVSNSETVSVSIYTLNICNIYIYIYIYIYILTRIEQLSRYTVINKSQVSHFLRTELKIRKGERPE